MNWFKKKIVSAPIDDATDSVAIKEIEIGIPWSVEFGTYDAVSENYQQLVEWRKTKRFFRSEEDAVLFLRTIEDAWKTLGSKGPIEKPILRQEI